jgi:hypothetical protein
MTYIHEYRLAYKHNFSLLTNIEPKNTILIINGHYYFRYFIYRIRYFLLHFNRKALFKATNETIVNLFFFASTSQ